MGIGIFIAGVFAAQEALALSICRCIDPGLPEKAKENSVAVFSGTVKKVKWQGGETDRVTIEVDKSWKGMDKKEVIVLTEHPSLTEKLLDKDFGCGYSFEEGEKYLVYTYVDKLSPHKVSSCSRTKKLSETTEGELKELGNTEWESGIGN